VASGQLQGSIGASTYKSYGQQVRRYLKPSLGQMKLRKLSPMHVQDLYRGMQDRGLSARTVHYALAVLHRALEQATKWEW
jgi:integrase